MNWALETSTELGFPSSKTEIRNTHTKQKSEESLFTEHQIWRIA